MLEKFKQHLQQVVLTTLCVFCGGVCWRAVYTSNSGFGGLGFKPYPSRCFLRQGTVLHFVFLHTGVKWIPALYYWGVTL